MKKTYYWHDAIHDDFASTNINTKDIPENYKYCSRNPFWLFFETLIRIIALPIIFLILKILYLFRLKNRKALNAAKGKGYFLYANHTNYMLDAYTPSVIAFPKKANIITNPDAVSIKGLGVIVKALGAVPVPASPKRLAALKNAVNTLAARGRVIAIYPEAHIWPYYTDIRPFGKQSFHYPAETGLPCFTLTNIYTERKLKFIKYPKVVSYIDGPFYPDSSLSPFERVEKLRDDVYGAMKKRVDENPKYNYCDYVYVDDASKTNKKNIS